MLNLADLDKALADALEEARTRQWPCSCGAMFPTFMARHRHVMRAPDCRARELASQAEEWNTRQRDLAGINVAQVPSRPAHRRPYRRRCPDCRRPFLALFVHRRFCGHPACEERRRLATMLRYYGRHPKATPGACASCGTLLSGRRRDARFCSAPCRQRAHRHTSATRACTTRLSSRDTVRPEIRA